MYLFFFSGRFFLLLRILKFYIFVYLVSINVSYILEWDFFFFSLLNIEIFIYLDNFFFCIGRIVRFIRGIVIFYSYYYIEGIKFNTRFLFLLICFILSILVYIISPRIIRIFLGWDGLGLVSYLLVNYYSNKSSLNSGILTVLSNRLGDVFLLVGVYISLVIGGWKFVFWDRFDIILIFILASFTKRAQLPFSSWLPFAIRAPTPVSSLVHSSTLVTAGVFLIFRILILIDTSRLYFIFSTGIITMLISRVCGIFEADLKKVIALSTLSQLGIIIVILGLGYKEYCFFHIIIHALFKSRLFIRIGCKIHEFINFQDSRHLRSYWKNRIVDFFFGTTNLALIGFPFLSGFFSKDLSIEFMISNNLNLLLWIFIILSIILTVGYSLKFIILGRLNISNFIYIINSNYNNKIVFYRVCFLLLLRITFGFIYCNLFLDFYIIIDIVFFIKFAISLFLYYLYLFIWNYILNKNIIINKILSIFSYLLFLNKLFIWFRKNIKDYLWHYKLEDRGYLDLLKWSRLLIILVKSYIYIEIIIFSGFYIFIILLFFELFLI